MSDEPGSDVVPVLGVPIGLVALAIRRPDGSLPRDRRGRLKVGRVRLTASSPGNMAEPGESVGAISDDDVRWSITAQRRHWPSVVRRFGTNARAFAIELAAAGVVDLICSVDDRVGLGEIHHWQRTSPWQAHWDEQNSQRSDHAARWELSAREVAQRVAARDEGLADALLRVRATSPKLPVLVHAARDLVAGVVHDGPRAFSQAHFGDTKSRDDVPAILAEAGASPDTLITLGLRRSPYVGLGGRLKVRTESTEIPLSSLDGPVQFRIDQHGVFEVRMDGPPRDLAVIENLQAAEAVCDMARDLAVLWCAGQPSDAVVRLVGELSNTASRVIVATDADLGGVRIARRVLGAVRDLTKVTVLDAGASDHPVREPFGQVSRDGLTEACATGGPVGTFARSCLDRGYPVEQEATIRQTLRMYLHVPTDAVAQ